MAAPFVRRELQIAAPRATVFAFLTDPDRLLRWIGTEANVDPQVDGLYLVNVTGANRAEGRFTEVAPVHRLAYSLGRKERGDMPPGSSLIEIDLLERDGGTLLRLTHRGLPDADGRADTAAAAHG